MAYVTSIPKEEFKTEVFQNGSDCGLIVNIGYDNETGAIYSLVVGLSPMAGGNLEYYFHIVEAYEDDSETKIYWSGKDTDFIPQEERKEILAVLLSLTFDLIKQNQPELVFLVTHDRDLPAKALKKHTILARIFKDAGYKVTRFNEFHGKVSWMMERVKQP